MYYFILYNKINFKVKPICHICHTYLEKYKRIKLIFCSHGADYYLTVAHVWEQFNFKPISTINSTQIQHPQTDDNTSLPKITNNETT